MDKKGVSWTLKESTLAGDLHIFEKTYYFDLFSWNVTRLTIRYIWEALTQEKKMWCCFYWEPRRKYITKACFSFESHECHALKCSIFSIGLKSSLLKSQWEGLTYETPPIHLGPNLYQHYFSRRLPHRCFWQHSYEYARSSRHHRDTPPIKPHLPHSRCALGPYEWCHAYWWLLNTLYRCVQYPWGNFGGAIWLYLGGSARCTTLSSYYAVGMDIVAAPTY